MSRLAREVVITGIGMTPVARSLGRSSLDLTAEALAEFFHRELRWSSMP